MAIMVTIKGADDAAKAIKTYKQKVLKEVGLLVFVTGKNIQKDAKLEVPVDTGLLRSTIRVRPLGFSFEKSVSANTHYAAKVEFVNKSYLRKAYRNRIPDFKRKMRKIFES